MFERFAMQCWVLVALIAMGGAWPVLAEDLSAEDEAAIMAQEEEAEAALPLNKKPSGSLSGRVQLNSEPEENGVVGFFAAKDRAYQLLLAQPALLPQLQRYNGKTVVLQGKIRARGKYFVVEGIQVSVPGVPRTDREQRSGM
jgi:hypothetical protein